MRELVDNEFEIAVVCWKVFLVDTLHKAFDQVFELSLYSSRPCLLEGLAECSREERSEERENSEAFPQGVEFVEAMLDTHALPLPEGVDGVGQRGEALKSRSVWCWPERPVRVASG